MVVHPHDLRTSFMKIGSFLQNVLPNTNPYKYEHDITNLAPKKAAN
jgi:hypothetical protein